jgi:hypothetical protein
MKLGLVGQLNIIWAAEVNRSLRLFTTISCSSSLLGNLDFPYEVIGVLFALQSLQYCPFRTTTCKFEARSITAPINSTCSAVALKPESLSSLRGKDLDEWVINSDTSHGALVLSPYNCLSWSSSPHIWSCTYIHITWAFPELKVK